MVAAILLERPRVRVRPNHSTSSGMTPLGAAASRGHTFVMHALLRRGAHCDIATSLGDGRRTALMCAASAGRLRATAMLLERGADAAVRDAEGRTAWDAASDHPSVRWLLAAHAAGAASSGGALTSQPAHPAMPHVRLGNVADGPSDPIGGQSRKLGVGGELVPMRASVSVAGRAPPRRG